MTAVNISFVQVHRAFPWSHGYMWVTFNNGVRVSVASRATLQLTIVRSVCLLSDHWPLPGTRFWVRFYRWFGSAAPNQVKPNCFIYVKWMCNGEVISVHSCTPFTSEIIQEIWMEFGIGGCHWKFWCEFYFGPNWSGNCYLRSRTAGSWSWPLTSIYRRG
jgi:hypothetical protein